jgi:hypothetical protein
MPLPPCAAGNRDETALAGDSFGPVLAADRVASATLREAHAPSSRPAAAHAAAAPTLPSVTSDPEPRTHQFAAKCATNHCQLGQSLGRPFELERRLRPSIDSH